MKATQIGFINSMPEVKVKPEGLKIDYGTLDLELTHREVELLLINIFTKYDRAKRIVNQL